MTVSPCPFRLAPSGVCPHPPHPPPTYLAHDCDGGGDHHCVGQSQMQQCVCHCGHDARGEEAVFQQAAADDEVAHSGDGGGGGGVMQGVSGGGGGEGEVAWALADDAERGGVGGVEEEKLFSGRGEVQPPVGREGV